jgi:hypothetical protein
MFTYNNRLEDAKQETLNAARSYFIDYKQAFLSEKTEKY